MSQLDGSLSSIIRLTGSGAHQSPAMNLGSGQVYRATVEQVNAGAVLLRIGELSLRAETDARLNAGQTLLVRWNRNSEPASLEIVRVLPLPEHRPRQNQAPATQEQVNPRIQSLLARQASPLMLFSLLGDLQPANYSAEMATLLQKVQAHLLTPAQVTDGAVLKSAIRHSGLWLEALLFAILGNPGQAARLQDDLKLALLRLRAGQGNHGSSGALQLLDEGLASTLAQVTEGVLARMSLHQIHSVLQAEQGHLHWSVDLPMRLGDQTVLLALTIRREHGHQANESSSENSQEQSWHVELDTELERLGPLRINLYLREQQLSVALETSREQSTELLARSLLSLEEQLRELGFQVETLLSRPLPDSESGAADSWYENLIEVSV